MPRPKAFRISGVDVEPGTRTRIEIPVAEPYGMARVGLPVVVLHGRHPGPTLFVSAAIHGDELIGVEIIRRLLKTPALRRVSGTFLAVPIVNVYGFLTQSRYLPDRRDLNRNFPGSPKGSLASRLANVLMEQVVSRATHGIDLHTATHHRTNLPHVRGSLDDAETARLARVFGAPVILNASVRDGSLRQAVADRKMPMLVYEGGEALRFNEVAIRVGVRGVLNVMRHLGMLPARSRRSGHGPVLAQSSYWLRAPDSGLLRTAVALGARVRAGQVVGVINDPVGDHEYEVKAPASGIVIGKLSLPLVNEGDALFHIATFVKPGRAARAIEAVHGELDPTIVASPSGEPPIV